VRTGTGSTVIGLCGGSGSGKTTLAQEVTSLLGRNRAQSISFDAYYRDLSHLSVEERARVNYDSPVSLDVDLLTEHLDSIRRGRDIAVPVYDFSTHTRSGHLDLVEPTDFVIIEGILLFAFPEIRELLDVRVFLDCPADIRFRRRLRRDVEERGRTEQSVRRQWHQMVNPMHDLHVQPHAEHAHLIVAHGRRPPEIASTIVELADSHRGGPQPDPGVDHAIDSGVAAAGSTKVAGERS
jgi:uridine kinase